MRAIKNTLFNSFIAATTADSPIQSARWAFCAQISDDNNSRYTTLKLSFGEKWYREHKSKWYQFVQHCLIKLNPIVKLIVAMKLEIRQTLI